MPDEEKQKPPKSQPQAEAQAEAQKDVPGSEGAEAGSHDRFQPADIAARIERLGQETDVDRIAREEEQKLAERRQQQKKGKRGLEASASKRLAKIGEGTVKRPSAARDAYVPEADPLVERLRHVRQWIEHHRGTFGVIVTVVVVVVGGGLGYLYWQGKHEADGSALLAQAFAAEHGHVSDKDKEEDDDDTSTPARQLYPTFKSVGDRQGAALAKYRDVESKYAGTGAAILARLGEAGLLLDKGDAKGATQAYEDVKRSALSQADAEVRGRALEGLGFADELSAQTDAANAQKHLDDALAAFKSLEQVDVKGFKELGLYHQARVLQAKGEKDKAIELLKDVHKRVTEPGETHPFPYLEFVVEDRLRALDPSALPPKAPKLGGPGGAGGKPDMDNPQVQELIRQLQEQARQKGGGIPSPVGTGGAP